MNRRRFLKLLGSTAAVAAAAPLVSVDAPPPVNAVSGLMLCLIDSNGVAYTYELEAEFRNGVIEAHPFSITLQQTMTIDRVDVLLNGRPLRVQFEYLPHGACAGDTLNLSSFSIGIV